MGIIKTIEGELKKKCNEGLSILDVTNIVRGINMLPELSMNQKEQLIDKFADLVKESVR